MTTISEHVDFFNKEIHLDDFVIWRDWERDGTPCHEICRIVEMQGELAVRFNSGKVKLLSDMNGNDLLDLRIITEVVR